MISVLVVDDDFRVARIHSSFVSRTDGFEVVGVAHTGAEVLATVGDLRPDLILLDLYLPDVFGLDLVNRLRVAGVQADVMVISAADEFATVQQAVQLGVTSYLLKPFRLADLQQRLDDYRATRASSRSSTLRDQADVDRLFGRGHPSSPEQLPKGMSPETARLVMAAVAAHDGDCSASECAAEVGLSRVSARRYLEHFTALGLIEVRLRYGSAGRPERRYALVPSGSAAVQSGHRPAEPT
ncbi:MAG TPA: response regulator [Propionibacteriaceae bacterium]|nr:response regulator [Propionibacteriaceae bacterium]